MGTYGEIVAAGARMSRGYSERLLKDVTAEIFARKPKFDRAGAPVVVDTNHPAWVFGHLGLYFSRVLDMAGRDGSVVAAPAGFAELFEDGKPCQDDPRGTIYPAMATITRHYFAGFDALLDALPKIDDAVFTQVTPDEKRRERFPRVGALVSFLSNNHPMMHNGQVSAWRRCMGLGAA